MSYLEQDHAAKKSCQGSSTASGNEQGEGARNGEVGMLLQVVQGLLQMQMNVARETARERPFSLDHFLRLAPPYFK